MSKYKLIKVLIADSPKASNNGKIGTPIIGFVLKNLESGILEVMNRHEAHSVVTLHGAVNVEAKTREFQGEIIPYLKPTNGRKINEYMIKIEDNLK